MNLRSPARVGDASDRRYSIERTNQPAKRLFVAGKPMTDIGCLGLGKRRQVVLFRIAEGRSTVILGENERPLRTRRCDRLGLRECIHGYPAAKLCARHAWYRSIPRPTFSASSRPLNWMYNPVVWMLSMAGKGRDFVQIPARVGQIRQTEVPGRVGRELRACARSAMPLTTFDQVQMEIGCPLF